MRDYPARYIYKKKLITCLVNQFRYLDIYEVQEKNAV